MISENTIQELKALDPIDVVGRYVKLKKVGSGYMGICPFHNEHTPSFSVRENKGYHCFGCGASGDVIAFIMAIEGKTFPEAVEHLAGMTGIMIGNDVPIGVIPKIKPIQPVKQERVDYIPEEKITGYLAAFRENNLYKFFSSIVSEAKTDEIFQRYGAGTYKDGRVIFIQRNITGSINQVKLMKYGDPVTGKRGHGKWDSLIAGTNDDFMGEDANLVQCFFGEHLLPENEGKPVAIVESEKTAMIASLHYPKFLWIATGGKSGCSMTRPEVNKVLKGRHIHLFPDVDGISDWRKAADELKRQGFAVFVNDVMASKAPAGSHEDIADLILRAKQPLPTPAPQWYVDMQGVLRQYQAGEITGDQFFDLQNENWKQSGLNGPDYVKQVKSLSNGK